MTERLLFTADKYTWSGGFYQLAIELGPRDDARLDAAIHALWDFPALAGCWNRRDVEPEPQERYCASLAAFEAERRLLGVLTLPEDNARVACDCFIVREEQSEIDWISLCIPMGGLSTVREVGAFPFGGVGVSSRSWHEPLDQLLVQIGEWIFERAPFRLALTGHEVGGDCYAEQVAARGLPRDRWIGYLYPGALPAIGMSRQLLEGFLEWFPPTIYDPPYDISHRR